MRRKLTYFLFKFLFILFLISFSLSFIFYAGFKEKEYRYISQNELQKAIEDYVNKEISLIDNLISHNVFYSTENYDVNKIKVQTGADFVMILNENLIVLFSYSGVTGYSFLKNEYITSLLTNTQTPLNTFAYLPYEFLNKGLLSISLDRDTLTYVCINPFFDKGKKRYLLLGYLISGTKKSLFSRELLFADSLYLISKDEEIVNLQGLQLPSHVLQQIKSENIEFLTYEKHKYHIVRKDIKDIKGTKLATLIAIKKAQTLVHYYKQVLVFSLYFSIFFLMISAFLILSHYKRAKDLLMDLEVTIENFSKGDFTVVKSVKRTKEFIEIYEVLEKISKTISNNIKMLSNEIKVRTSEIFEINKALILLSKCSDIETLIDRSMHFLKSDLGFNTLNINECNKNLTNCEECNLKKIGVRIDGQEKGFCVDFSAVKEDYIKDFLDIFQEIFVSNFIRISNSIKIRETNLEYLQLSEVLINLLAKKSVDDIFILILEKAKDICKADTSFIGVYDRNTDTIHLKFFININTDEFKSLRFSKSEGLGGLVIRERRGIFVSDYFNDSRINASFKDIVQKEGIISTIAVPIFYEDEIFGILYVGYRTLKKEVTYELSFLQKMATAAALAIERQNYTNELKNKEIELRKAYDEILEKRKEINELIKGYKDANLELERRNRELMEQYEIVKKSYEELNYLNKAKDLFLGILSHELKTPITITKGYIETLLSKDFELSERVKNSLSTALKSINNLSEKVDDLLDYMRLETKKLKLYIKEISLKETLEEVLKELSPFLEERKQRLVLKEGDVSFKADAKWIKKAFSSIINNSIKFSPDGKNIYIDFEVVGKESLRLPDYVKERPGLANKYLIISIKDEGIGIPEDEINKIFDSFYELGDIRTHSTGKYKFMSKGVGLGLSFTKQIIHMHNGIIYAESPGFDLEKYPGTTIKIVLPLDETEKDEVKKKDSILIIDNDYDFSRFLEIFLSQNYNVHIFEDGGVGYLKILEIKPKVVMINVNLKNYDGYEVCSIIKEDKQIKDIPVILYGTGPESFDEIRAQRVKANMIFYPIFDTENLQRIVDYYMKK